jgi:hypothetical protein
MPSVELFCAAARSFDLGFASDGQEVAFIVDQLIYIHTIYIATIMLSSSPLVGMMFLSRRAGALNADFAKRFGEQAFGATAARLRKAEQTATPRV